MLKAIGHSVYQETYSRGIRFKLSVSSFRTSRIGERAISSLRPSGRLRLARCPELNVTSQGETLEEAEENIKEAIELYIESFGAEDIPQTSIKPYLTLVEVANV